MRGVLFPMCRPVQRKFYFFFCVQMKLFETLNRILYRSGRGSVIKLCMINVNQGNGYGKIKTILTD